MLMRAEKKVIEGTRSRQKITILQNEKQIQLEKKGETM